MRSAAYRIMPFGHAILRRQLRAQKTAKVLWRIGLSFITHRLLRPHHIVGDGLSVVTKYFAGDPCVAIGVINFLSKEFRTTMVLERTKLRRLRSDNLGLWQSSFNRNGKLALS